MAEEKTKTLREIFPDGKFDEVPDFDKEDLEKLERRSKRVDEIWKEDPEGQDDDTAVVFKLP